MLALDLNFHVPIEFLVFGIMLVGIALFHDRALQASVTGLAAIAIYKIAITGFNTGPGLEGFFLHLGHEWVVLTNLFCLLTGFALVSDHFERSHLPAVLPKFLPSGWRGAFAVLLVVWVLSSFLDNIAGALIGGAMARQLFRDKVHVGFLAAIVAASNAGGAWSVLGDTTTTMMWLAGVSPAKVFEAIIGALVALVVFGIPAAIQQHNYSPISRTIHARPPIDWIRLTVVAVILLAALATNMTVNLRLANFADHFPFLGVAVWVAILVTVVLRPPDWNLLPEAVRGSIFLLGLVLSASMMPVEYLPAASSRVTFGLGFLSAVFDNIPLTALALKQGGYDWGLLAYAVGFGGSMIWFGSSAGVALSNMYPEARSIRSWLQRGWHIPVAYVVGFFAILR